MEIIPKEENGVIRIIVKGRLDAESAPKAERIIKGVLEKGKTRLLFDLCELEYLSSAGLRVILHAAKKAFGKGGKIVLCCLNEIVKEIFESSQFPIADSVEDGLKEFP